MAVDPIRLSAPVEHDGVKDRVAIEDPLEIRVRGEALAVTMRTPGNDEELALGFLHGEGLIDTAAPVGPTPDLAANIVDVDTPLRFDPGRRRFYTTSSCGVCGKGALEEVAVHAPALPGRPARRAAPCWPTCPSACASPPSSARAACTPRGCSTADGTLLLVREDVGRHNAMDKVVGRALLDGLLPLHPRLLCVSGRLSFELVQKAAVAGAPVLVGVGAPTSLAGRARRRPRDDAVRLRAPRERERLHRRGARAGRVAAVRKPRVFAATRTRSPREAVGGAEALAAPPALAPAASASGLPWRRTSVLPRPGGGDQARHVGLRPTGTSRARPPPGTRFPSVMLFRPSRTPQPSTTSPSGTPSRRRPSAGRAGSRSGP